MANNKIIDLNALSRFKDNCDAEYQATLVSGTNIKTINNTSILGSGNYAFDTQLNELSTNAVENQVVSKEFREINYEIAMIREALFEVVLSEIDYSVDYAMTYVVPDTLSDTDGTHRVVYSETELVSMQGNSVVDNQQLENGNFASATGWDTSNATISVSNNVCSMTANAQNGVVYHFYIYPTSHSILLVANVKLTTANTNIKLRGGGVNAASSQSTTSWQTLCGIISNYSGGGTVGIRDERSSDWDTVQVSNFMCIDLTQMFGAGNEPTSTDDVRIKWLLSRGYIAYNTVSLLSTNVSGVYSYGANLFDITNYTNVSNVRCYIVDIKGNGYYTISANKNVWDFAIANYENGTFTNVHTNSTKNISSFTFQETNYQSGKTYYCLIRLSNLNYDNDLSDYDIMLNHGQSALPYKQYLSLPLSTISFTTQDLKSAGSVHDYLEVVEGNVIEGEQRYDIVKHLPVGTYTFTGNESWLSFGSVGAYYCANVISGASVGYASSPNMIIGANINITNTMNVVEVGTTNSIATNGTNVYATGDVYQSLVGKTIYYELATEPTPTTIETDLTFEQVSLIIQQGGTLNTNFTNVPPNVTTKFVVKKAIGE